MARSSAGGIPTSVALLGGFVLVCVAELFLGVMILVDAPGTKALAVALLPFEFFYWVGFALPLAPPAGIARTVLLFL